MVCDLLAGGDLRYHLTQKVSPLYNTHTHGVMDINGQAILTFCKYSRRLGGVQRSECRPTCV